MTLKPSGCAASPLALCPEKKTRDDFLPHQGMLPAILRSV